MPRARLIPASTSVCARLAAMLALAFILSGGSLAQTSDAPVADGQTIVMTTHSFAVFIGPEQADPRRVDAFRSPGLLASLAAERGKQGHETLAMQMIGGSSPMQHWLHGGRNDAKHPIRSVLARGGVDVFIMTPGGRLPEEGIDLFGDFVARTNPQARVMVQASWAGFDGQGASGAFANADRDQTTSEQLAAWIAGEDGRGDAYLPRLRKQLEGIDTRAGREITFVVPAGAAVYALRQHVLAGDVPGVTKQSQLFTDAIGHPARATAHLVTYVWYAAMYRESPVGLQALVNPRDPASAAREKILQQIAWNALVSEPKSGVKGEAVRVGSR